MRSIRSLKRSKSGVSTVLGMLFCVGILFSVVIPLFLYVNQVNNLYNRTVVEMGEFDKQRSMESLMVFAYPSANQCISVYVRNRGVVNVNVTRTWITDLENNTVHLISGANSEMLLVPPSDLPLILASGSDHTVIINGSSLALGSRVNIKVTTEKGNIFVSESNPLYMEEEAGAMPYTIDVIIQSSKEGRKRYVIYTEQLNQTTEQPTGWNNTVTISMVGGFVQMSIGVPSTGKYHLKIYRSGLEDYPLYNQTVYVPRYSPIVVQD